jgi:cyanate permease
MSDSSKRSMPLRAIFAWPAAISLLGIIGLVSALTGDGWRDGLSWLALGAPVAVLAWAMQTRRH